MTRRERLVTRRSDFPFRHNATATATLPELSNLSALIAPNQSAAITKQEQSRGTDKPGSRFSFGRWPSGKWFGGRGWRWWCRPDRLAPGRIESRDRAARAATGPVGRFPGRSPPVPGVSQGPAVAARWVWSLSRLCVAAASRHSDRTAERPRRWKRSIPRLCLICPNTGSIVAWRFL
jgi:hypothetical protein